MHGRGPFRTLLSAGVLTAAMLPLAAVAFSTDPGGGPAPDPTPGPPDPAPAPTPPADPPAPTDPAPVDLAAEVEKWKGLARKHEGRSTAAVQAFAAAARKLGLDPKDLAASEQDSAVATAREESRAETLREVAHERVESAFIAAAAGKMTDAQRDALIEDINPDRFLTDDGKVDKAKIVKRIEALAPAATNGGPDLGQGRRDPAGKATGVSVGREMYAESRKRSTTPAA